MASQTCLTCKFRAEREDAGGDFCLIVRDHNGYGTQEILRDQVGLVIGGKFWFVWNVIDSNGCGNHTKAQTRREYESGIPS